MKILKIEFTNINSLRGSHEIDFTKEPFISSSLFAITGPTGSGKSTILDVISLALYGKIPRIPGSRPISKTDIEKFGTILTRNQKEAIARVTYECKHGIFSSQWNISTNRNENLRDNDMEIFDHQKQELITEKKSEVPDMNEELIGLSYDQFIKAVLLAQGEFAQFLKVTKKERGALLEKITGTGVYRLLGQKVYEKNGLLNKVIEKQQTEIGIIKNALMADEVLESKKKDILIKTTELENFQKDIEGLKNALELKKSIQKQASEISSLEDERLLAVKKLSIFDEEHGAPLKQHEKVQDFSEELRNWNLYKQEEKKIREEQITTAHSSKANSDKITALLSNVSAFTRTDTNTSNLYQHLTNFRDKILTLQEQRKEKLNEHTLERTKLKAELDQTSIELNNESPNSLKIAINESVNEIVYSLKSWKDEFQVSESEEIANLRAKFQENYKKTREASREYAAIEALEKEIYRNSSDLEKIQPQLQELPDRIDKQQKKVENCRTKEENLTLKRENELLKASLQQHRHSLRDGEACPLCGALDHPYAEQLPEKDTSLDLRLEEIRKELAIEISILNTATTNLENFRRSAEELKANAINLKNNLQQLNVNFKAKFGELSGVKNIQELEKTCDDLEKKIEDLNQFATEQKKLKHLKTALPILDRLDTILKDGKLLKEKINELYSGNNVQQEVENYQNNWISLERDQKNLKDTQTKLQSEVEQLVKKIKSSEGVLLPLLKAKGFVAIEEAYAVLMHTNEANQLRKERQEIQKSIDNSIASLKLLKIQLEELVKNDVESKEEKVLEQLQLKLQQLDALSTECKEMERIIKNQDESVLRLNSLQEQIAEKEKETRRWRMLNELIGDRTGNKFNDFAQDLSLSRLIKLANARLKDLSDRYLIDKPTEDEDDGLVAIDAHMGGQRRSVKTLSGGETFILSLSMALALSDLASKNVEINSLFIDEGFGTLDPETLDQTLDTLEKLQAESSKTIGIISHVDSLKERIATQIKLTRNGQGYSTLKVESL
ncbi:exonuclease SbcC [Gillisia sp. Hel1_33_143]|uniref:AAA family ATPase n=1 Tax=Gillisia sp. Hel1_33_143 TaxID=1336796 RepID=UPI00087C5539|nr:AAA family ATPase [Gillisia sp. Hel1_33_143]SDS76825.1 exonuclease SbcC [Gillisia sp. Hel1_33_143]